MENVGTITYRIQYDDTDGVDVDNTQKRSNISLLRF